VPNRRLAPFKESLMAEQKESEDEAVIGAMRGRNLVSFGLKIQ